MFNRRISILVGHFGSGKSEIAVNYSMRLAGTGVPVSLVDLDVVKPYFRSRSARRQLADSGVELVAPGGDNFYADLPIMLPRVRGLCLDPQVRVVIDVGGDEAGARAIGSLADVLRPDDADVVAVLNFRRPLTPDVDSAVSMVRGIEGHARLRVTGVISNTHLMQFTTPAIVREGYQQALITAAALGIKVIAVSVPSVLKNAFRADEFDCDIFPVSRVIRTAFAADNDPQSLMESGSVQPDGLGLDQVGRKVVGQYGVRKIGPLFVPAGMPDEEG